MHFAITRPVSPALAHCELTHLRREPIDLARAEAQHAAYEQALADLGCEVRRLPVEPELPDSVFVEDTAVVLDEVAIIARPGAASRRAETPGIARRLQTFRRLAAIEAPATLDGGDVLQVGRRLWVGRSSRTNAEGRAQLWAIVEGLGYELRSVDIRDCLHLKSAVTRVGERTVLLDPAMVDADAFADLDRIEVDGSETLAANALAVGASVLVAKAFPRTRDRLLAAGFDVRTVDASELAKAEGGLTCCSLVLSRTSG